MMAKRLLAIGALAALALCASCSSGGAKHSSATTTTTANDHRFAKAFHPTVGVTAEQLVAHLGIGLPRRWEPVDVGDARIWVPDTWTVDTTTLACGLPDRPPVVGVVGIDTVDFSCPSDPSFDPQQAVSLISSSASPDGTHYEVVHGYRIYRVALTADPTSTVYDVPELGVRIVLHGAFADRILSTLAPSAQEVALAFATQPPPITYRRVITDGMSLSIPSRWWMTTTPAVECYWQVSPSGAPEVVRVRPGLSLGPCAAYSSLPLAVLPNDGILLYTSQSAYSPHRGDRAIAILHHRSTTITVYRGSSSVSLDTVSVFIHRTGSKITHVLTLGLGRDGRTAGRILASIQAIT